MPPNCYGSLRRTHAIRGEADRRSGLARTSARRRAAPAAGDRSCVHPGRSAEVGGAVPRRAALPARAARAPVADAARGAAPSCQAASPGSKPRRRWHQDLRTRSEPVPGSGPGGAAKAEPRHGVAARDRSRSSSRSTRRSRRGSFRPMRRGASSCSCMATASPYSRTSCGAASARAACGFRLRLDWVKSSGDYLRALFGVRGERERRHRLLVVRHAPERCRLRPDRRLDHRSARGRSTTSFTRSRRTRVPQPA